ncbi:replicative helicase loader/inhibitor [Thermoanaerobacter mathranii]|uniref:replicative helicase loader/inhibitor n=1 Tax=Thermoanaerobacter mathranii TaxID=583357 RepID=UPI003D6B201B
MTSNEVMRILAIIASSYPQYTRQIQRNLENMAVVWGAFLRDIPFETALAVLQHLIPKSQYPPTIYDFRKELLEIAGSSEPDAVEAWGEVTRAVKLYGVYRPEEALNSLSDITREVVEAIGWREICLTEDINVVRAHFIKLFEVYRERKLEEKLLNISTLLDTVSRLADGNNKPLNRSKGVNRIKNIPAQIKSVPEPD